MLKNKKNLANTYLHRGHPPTIVGYIELNFCVRYGNRCDLNYIFTRKLYIKKISLLYSLSFSLLHSHSIVLNAHWKIYSIQIPVQSRLPNFSWLSPRPISTGHLNILLHLQLQPIKHMCLYVVLLDWLNEISYLVAGFTLRCFQRLSLPNLATQPCNWCYNWCTICLSILVLSY